MITLSSIKTYPLATANAHDTYPHTLVSATSINRPLRARDDRLKFLQAFFTNNFDIDRLLRKGLRPRLVAAYARHRAANIARLLGSNSVLPLPSALVVCATAPTDFLMCGFTRENGKTASLNAKDLLCVERKSVLLQESSMTNSGTTVRGSTHWCPTATSKLQMSSRTSICFLCSLSMRHH